MRGFIQISSIALSLSLTTQHCCGLMMSQGLTKSRAEKELGVVIKREYIGGGTATNDAGIAVEFSQTGKLVHFSHVQLNVYSEWPDEQANGLMDIRRLVSTTLQPVARGEDKIRVFFTINAEYLDRTQISICVRQTNAADPDGYDIRLDSKDFPPPQPLKIFFVTNHFPTPIVTSAPQRPSTSNPLKLAQAKFTGGIGAALMTSTNNLFVIGQVLPNSPAEKAGLKAGDAITKVNGKPTAGRTLKDVVDDLRGIIGTTVTVTVQRGATNLDLLVHRTSWNNLQVEPPPLWEDNKLNPIPAKR